MGRLYICRRNKNARKEKEIYGTDGKTGKSSVWEDRKKVKGDGNIRSEQMQRLNKRKNYANY